MNELVKDFYENYYKFASHVTTKSKTKFESIDTLSSVVNVLDSLIKVIENNLLDEINKSDVYNTLLIAKMYSKKVKMPSDKSRKRFVMLSLEEDLNRLKNLNISPENLKNRH
jgi:hypothetical protein